MISTSPDWAIGEALCSPYPSTESGLTGLPAKKDAGSCGGVEGDIRIETDNQNIRYKLSSVII